MFSGGTVRHSPIVVVRSDLATIPPARALHQLMRDCRVISLVPFIKNGISQLFCISFACGGCREQPRQLHRYGHLDALFRGFPHRRIQDHLQRVDFFDREGRRIHSTKAPAHKIANWNAVLGRRFPAGLR